jgi:predicted RNA-binding Zn ribbon-like protein
MLAHENLHPEFRFGLGDVSLEFVATLAGRHRVPFDRLAGPRELGLWLIEAGLLVEARCDERDLTVARELREAIYRTLSVVRKGRRASEEDLALINRAAREAVPAPQLDVSLRMTWTSADPVAGALARVAASAIRLLGGTDMEQARECADPTCSLLFIDRSRPGRRRWCSMERCGNRSKTARYRQRSRA